MKLPQKLIQQYNTPDTVIVISTYPRKGHTFDPKALAVAPLTQGKLKAISQAANSQNRTTRFVVIADRLNGPQIYEEKKGQILVIRIWERNSLSVYWQIQKAISLFSQAQSLIIEHEFGIFGLKNSITAQFPVFLLTNRLQGKKVVLVLHQVIYNLSRLSGHLNLPANSLKSKLYSLLIRLNCWLFGLFASHIVTLDSHLKTKLSRYVNSNKITTLAHPNHGHYPLPSKSKLRQKLGIRPNEFIVIFLGYVTWYKGADWLVKAFSQIHPQLKTRQKIRLIIAGGPSSSLEIDSKYMNYYQSLVKLIDQTYSVTLTGVLSEKELPQYAKAADLMIMPYRVMMGASGPFSIAQSTQTPVIVSDNLKPMTHSTDVKNALRQAGLKSQDLIFKFTPEGLLTKLNQALNQKNYLKQLSHFMALLLPQRTADSQASEYLSLLNPQKTETLYFPQPATLSPSLR